MGKILKNTAFVLAIALWCVSTLAPAKASGAGADQYANQAEEEEVGMGTVHISFLVDSIYMYKDSIQVLFFETSTQEIYTVSAKEFRQDTVDTVMPEGEWAFYAVQFEEKAVYGVRGYLSGADTFTVFAGEETSIGITVEDYQTSTQLMYVDLVPVNQDGFDGIVQMWISGEADAYYTDTEGILDGGYVGGRIQETYTLRFDANLGYTTMVDAGTYCVEKAYAYTKDGMPLDLYYEPEITISRYSDDPQIKVEIYVPGEGGSSSGRYEVSLASDAPEFAYNYYYRDVTSLMEYLGLPDDDPLSSMDRETMARQAEQEEREYQELLLEEITAEEAEGEEGEEDAGGDASFPVAAALCAFFLPVWAICWFFWQKRKKKRT